MTDRYEVHEITGYTLGGNHTTDYVVLDSHYCYASVARFAAAFEGSRVWLRKQNAHALADKWNVEDAQAREGTVSS